MTKNKSPKLNEKPQAANPPVVQQFAAGGSAVATPEVPYDVEKVDSGTAAPAPAPGKGEPRP